MTSQRVLTELSAKEKAAALVMTGRAISETFKGLDIIPPEFALIVTYDALPLIASNIQGKDELLEYVRMIGDSILKGTKVAPVCVPKRLTMKESFMANMRRHPNSVPLDPESLAGLIRTYYSGFLDAVLQYGGIKVVQELAYAYPEMVDPRWVPGPEWHYWEDS